MGYRIIYTLIHCNNCTLDGSTPNHHMMRWKCILRFSPGMIFVRYGSDDKNQNSAMYAHTDNVHCCPMPIRNSIIHKYTMYHHVEQSSHVRLRKNRSIRPEYLL